MEFFKDIIKKAHAGIDRNGQNMHIIFPIQRAYIKVKSKYRGLEGKIYCVKYFGGYTWHTTLRSWRKAMDKLACSGGDYLVLNDKRAVEIIIDNNEGVIE